MSRTPVLINDHIEPLVTYFSTYLGGLSHPVFVGFGERPIDANSKFYDPPYLVISYLAGGLLDGPITDSQADVSLRILILTTGKTAQEATVLRDIVHTEMSDKSNFSITNRKLRNLSVETPSDGSYRDDDAPSPIFYTRQIYLMDTTPI